MVRCWGVLLLAAGCSPMTSQLEALETWSAWTVGREVMRFQGGDARVTDRRMAAVWTASAALTEEGLHDLERLDAFLLTAPAPHDVYFSASDGPVLTVRFRVDGERREANLAYGDPDDPYASAWRFHEQLFLELASCDPDARLVTVPSGCRVHPLLR